MFEPVNQRKMKENTTPDTKCIMFGQRSRCELLQSECNAKCNDVERLHVVVDFSLSISHYIFSIVRFVYFCILCIATIDLLVICVQCALYVCASHFNECKLAPDVQTKKSKTDEQTQQNRKINGLETHGLEFFFLVSIDYH